MSLVADNTGLGLAAGRLRLSSSGLAGTDPLGLQLTGNLFYGNSDSRTQTRADAGLQGNAGAQSGFYEFNQPSGNSQSYNYPAGYSGNTWWHMIDTRHSNAGNNFAMQFSGSFFDQKLFFRKTNSNPSTAWNRIVNSYDASVTCGYLMTDVSAVNGTVEGSLTVQIVNGTLTVTGFNEGGGNLGNWYTLSNVANAKVVVLITNDDVANCGGSARVSSTRVFSVTNNGGASNQGTDMGCSGSDGNNMTFFITFNPL
jgi:hypothetical protein